jgi:hypothetical protein
MAEHYGFVVLPARVRKPRDKAKVEVAVLIVQRFVLARLRNRRFFSLQDLNAAIRACVTDLNAKVMRKIGKSRAELLETIDRPALDALPAEPYRYAEWKRCLVAPAHHVEIDKHYYSVPSRLIRDRRGAHHRYHGRDPAQAEPHCEPRPLGRPQGLPRRSLRVLSARAKAVRGFGAGARRWPLWAIAKTLARVEPLTRAPAAILELASAQSGLRLGAAVEVI